MGKKIVLVVGVVAIFCIVAIGSALLIGGGDIEAPVVSDLLPVKQIVPEEQNAFQALMDAGKTITLPSEVNMMVDYIQGKAPYGPMITEIIKKNEAAFSLIDQALAYNRCRAPETEDLSYLQNYYRILFVLGIRAVNDREAGRIDDSVRSTVHLLRLGKLVLADARRLAELNPALKIMRLGLDLAGDLARNDAASEENLNRLAGMLATLEPLGPGFQQAFRYKFKTVIDQIDAFRPSKRSLVQTFPDTALFPFFLRSTTWFPAYMFKENKTKQTLTDFYRDTIQNFSATYAGMKIYDLDEYFGLQRQSKYYYLYRPNLVGRVFYAFTTPEVNSYLESKVQMEGFIRATQLLIALELFERDNGGLPGELTALTPRYLDNLPLDPFTGKSFHYSAEKRFFYSVSKDLKDSGGSTKIPKGEIYGKDYPRTWITEDAVFEID